MNRAIILGKKSGRDLSLREKECIQLYIKGKTAKEVGEILGISRRTVEAHLAKIKNKLGVKNRSELLENVISEIIFY